MPVVGDVLVDTRDCQVLVAVGGADGDRGTFLGARVLGLTVGQGDLVVGGGGAPGEVLHGEGLMVPDINERRLPAAGGSGHLVAAAQHRGVPGDAGVGVDGLLHGGQVLDPGAYVDTQIGPTGPQVGGHTWVAQSRGDIRRQHHGEGAQRQDTEHQGVGGAQCLARPEPHLDRKAAKGGQSPALPAWAQGGAGAAAQGLDGRDAADAPQSQPGKADDSERQNQNREDRQPHAPQGGRGPAQVEGRRGLQGGGQGLAGHVAQGRPQH